MSSNDEPTDVQLDISKYEGHTDHQDWNYEWCTQNKGDSWVIYDINHQDALLLRDAPLLLEEVKRLRAEIAGIDALVLETYECVQNSVAPFGWESYLMKRFNLIAEHLGLLNNASK